MQPSAKDAGEQWRETADRLRDRFPKLAALMDAEAEVLAFTGFPQDLEDAARIDGCRSIGVLVRIFVPMSLPAIGALVIWVFIFSWNEFFWSLISLQRSELCASGGR